MTRVAVVALLGPGRENAAMTSRSLRRPVLRAAVVGLVPLLVGSLSAAPASAATVIGATTGPTVFCSAGYTYVQATDPPYSAPASGVITSWRFQAAGSPPQLKFKVLRPAGGSSYTVIGSTDPVTPAPSTLMTYTTRIPVRAGDVLGLALLTSGSCSSMGGSQGFVAGDSAVGSTLPYAVTPYTLNVAAVLEPDADGDGFGDETQDTCPSQAGTQGVCDTTAPDSRLTSGPKRTTRPKATFTFTSDDPAARYECRLTGRKVKSIELSTFQPCTSPKKYKRLKPGKYTVSVRAVDVAGNVEATPATSRLKVKAKPR